MSSSLRLTILGVLCFVLGFAVAVGLSAARWLPTSPQPGLQADPDDLAWENDGGTVRLSATSPGEHYLVLAADDGGDPGSAPPPWHVDTTLTLRTPVSVFRLVPWARCDVVGECNLCSAADDCVPPPPPPEWRGTRLWSPAVQ
jgi:hypothetical protein